jgi:class 3 adenylate cyclase
VSNLPLQSAALFDTRGEFARDLPVELITAWMNGKQSREAANQLLSPYRVTGTAVVSDSAGLTRLACQRDALEVMALISRPKELVYEFGTAVGGQPMGVWAADNTEMFYPETIGWDRIAPMLLGLQDHIREECEVQIGIAAHYGGFFRIGNVLYGKAAEFVEGLAEDRTSGGEIVLTESAWKQACTEPESAGLFQAVPRSESGCEFREGLRLVGGPRLARPQGSAGRYPVPFSEEFYECLRMFDRGGDVEKLRADVARRFARHGTVLLVERAPIQAETVEASILREMTTAVVARAHGALLLASTSGIEVKTAGSLSIYVFDNASEAWTFAVRLRTALEGAGIAARSGLATGELLIFDLEGGGREISGSPVNRASKVAQDCGQFGRIYVTDSLPEEMNPALEVTPSCACVAGVEIRVWVG